MAITTSTLTIIATVLGDAEEFLAGKPVTVEIPEEAFTVGTIKVTTAATSVTFTK